MRLPVEGGLRVGLLTEFALRRPPEATGGIRRVQVGCGPHNLLEDWWNVDILDFLGVDEVMDVTQPWRWSNILEYVFGEHFLEHLEVREGLKFLYFAGQALRIGGRIRLSTPSLEYVLRTHFQPDNAQRDIVQTFAINRAFHGWGHRFLYSREMLESCLEAVGFEDIIFCQYGESPTEALQKLERHGGNDRAVWIAEAAKGSKPIVMPSELLDKAEIEYGRYVDSGH
jgi:predicted SAM-dependent methyltransferase